MVHVGALPGTPRAQLSIEEIARRAANEALLYERAGADAVLIENMHDRPYLKGHVGPEIVAGMTRVATEIRQRVSFPCGLQILAAANLEALATATAAELQFVRVEGYVYAHVADEGWIDGCAADLLRERARLGADNIAFWTDLKKKHSAHAVTADVSLAETARAAAYNLSDALIITGPHTGEPAATGDLAAARRAAPELPICIGSGITADNVSAYLEADAYIVGSSLKVDGHWENTIDPARLEALLQAVDQLPRT